MGAVACIAVPWLVDRMQAGTPWQAMACAFNIGWHEVPKRTIFSFIAPRGYLTRPGFPNHDGNHAHLYEGFPSLAAPGRAERSRALPAA
jgi:hypothetical protein